MAREIKVGLVLTADGKGFRGEMRLNPCFIGAWVQTP